MLCAVQAVGVRPGPHGFFAVGPDQPHAVSVALFPAQLIRKLQQDGRYFACTDFRRQGSQDEYYDIDFWLDDKSGTVTVGEVRVHKVPQQEAGVWVQIPRYNFDGLNYEEVK